MIEEIQNLIDSYLAWLKDKTILQASKGLGGNNISLSRPAQRLSSDLC